MDINSKFVDACRIGDIEYVKNLLDMKADINAVVQGSSGLEWSAYKNNDVLLKFLLEHKADPNLNIGNDTFPSTALCSAVSTNIIKELINAKTDVNIGAPLLYISEINRDAIKILLDAKVDPNTKGYNGDTMLSTISWYNHTEIEYLLDAGVDVNVHDGNGCTPLMNVIDQYNDYSNPKDVLYSVSMVAEKADLSIKNNSGMNTIMFAVKNEAVGIVEILSEYPIDFDDVDKKGRNIWEVCLDIGCENNRRAIFDILIKKYRKTIEEDIRKNISNEVHALLCLDNYKIPNELKVGIIESL